MTKTKATSFRLEPDLRAYLERYADATHRTLNGALNAILAEHRATHESGKHAARS